jgi:hypothetical protein
VPIPPAPSIAPADAWLAVELARYTYKPGWSLQAESSVLGPCIMVRYTAPDSRAAQFKRRDLALAVRLDVPPFVHPDRGGDFAMWLLMALTTVEEHEAREWLRRDGEIYADPHEQAARG